MLINKTILFFSCMDWSVISKNVSNIFLYPKRKCALLIESTWYKLMNKMWMTRTWGEGCAGMPASFFGGPNRLQKNNKQWVIFHSKSNFSFMIDLVLYSTGPTSWWLISISRCKSSKVSLSWSWMVIVTAYWGWVQPT